MKIDKTGWTTGGWKTSYGIMVDDKTYVIGRRLLTNKFFSTDKEAQIFVDGCSACIKRTAQIFIVVGLDQGLIETW